MNGTELRNFSHFQILRKITCAHSEFWGGWKAVSLGGGMTVMEKRGILEGWVT